MKTTHYGMPVTKEQMKDMDEIRKKATELDDLIEKVCPKSRHSSIALTSLEKCSMFAIKAITHN